MLSFSYSLFTGTINGLCAIFVDILILVLCREQVYVLTSFFILVFFQMFFVSLALLAYLRVIANVRNYCRYSCNTQDYYYITLIIAYFGVMIFLITLCMTIYNLIVIRNEKIRRHTVPLTATYHPHQMTTMENV
jgi:hypothetical protein